MRKCEFLVRSAPIVESGMRNSAHHSFWPREVLISQSPFQLGFFFWTASQKGGKPSGVFLGIYIPDQVIESPAITIGIKRNFHGFLRNRIPPSFGPRVGFTLEIFGSSHLKPM